MHHCSPLQLGFFRRKKQEDLRDLKRRTGYYERRQSQRQRQSRRDPPASDEELTDATDPDGNEVKEKL
jgi:hypothetical protein